MTGVLGAREKQGHDGAWLRKMVRSNAGDVTDRGVRVRRCGDPPAEGGTKLAIAGG